MNINKRKKCFSNNTEIGIHTGNGTSNSIANLDRANANNFVVDCNIRKVRNEERMETYIRVNPNKNRFGYISTEYSEFKEIVQGVFDEIGIEDFEWKRIDLSFNSMDSCHYEDYAKLNRLLIACIADSSNDTNTYDTKNFWNGKAKSLATKNGYREVEFYDKKDATNYKSPYYSRLELRSKRISGSIEHEFKDIWFERLDKAVRHFEKVQERFNQNMAESYMRDLAKKKHDRDYLSITSFLMAKREYIFTSKQMRNLLMMIGLSENEARNKAYNFKKQHSIEYYKKEDLEAIVDEIKVRIIEYFEK